MWGMLLLYYLYKILRLSTRFGKLHPSKNGLHRRFGNSRSAKSTTRINLDGWIEEICMMSHPRSHEFQLVEPRSSPRCRREKMMNSTVNKKTLKWCPTVTWPTTLPTHCRGCDLGGPIIALSNVNCVGWSAQSPGKESRGKGTEPPRPALVGCWYASHLAGVEEDIWFVRSDTFVDRGSVPDCLHCRLELVWLLTWTLILDAFIFLVWDASAIA